MEFDQQLIDRTKRYFLARFGLEISDETADDYLSQFAELYASMAVFAAATPTPATDHGTGDRLSGVGSGGGGGRSPSADLISPHSC